MRTNRRAVSQIRKISQKSACCPDSEVVKTRVVFVNSDTSPQDVMRSYGATRQELISFKALIKRGGRGRDFEFKRIGALASNSRVLQGVQAVGSAFTPGNLSIIRSPIRSSIARTLTPGVPGMFGRGQFRDGVSRCPEGYQYGGRFTDNRFSTCGQKLFALPGPLGAIIGLIRRLNRAANPPVSQVNSTVLGAGDAPENIVQSRAPQIPKVTMSNPQKALAEIKKLVKPLGSVDGPSARMVRRDGFVLEPVVPPSVLRTIPDNRDMEGATYMLSTSSPDLIGKDELGLLSNTGVTSLKYVLPGGSVLTLEKRRQLTVGERRKLGRTVNKAIQSDNSRDPSARLKMVAEETGDGIGYTESFVGVSRPNDIGQDGKQRWATAAFKKRVAKAVDEKEPENQEREKESSAPIGRDITTLAGAVAHIQRGGSLSSIAPDILQRALAQVAEIKKDKINDNQTMLTLPNGDKYVQKLAKSDYEAIAQRFASQVQQHMGIESPNVMPVGTGDKRSYLVEDAATALKGAKIDTDAGFSQAPWSEVMRLMIADLLTDMSNRNSGSIEIADYNGKKKLIPISNDGAGLVELSKVSITERTEASIADLLTPSESALYLKFFKELQQKQRAQQLQFLATLVKRAREFNISSFRSRLYSDGKLSSGEKIHLNILETLYTTRLENLVRQDSLLQDIIAGNK
jgi:hypothetical protein